MNCVAEDFSDCELPAPGIGVSAKVSVVSASGGPLPVVPVSPALSLRLFKPEDAEELFALSDANRADLRRWMTWIEHTRDVAAARRFIDYSRREAESGGGLHYAVVEHGAIIGVCGFCRIERSNRRANIGYWLDAKARGRGVVTRCVTALALHGFARLELNRLVIACAVGNDDSASVAERCGFRFEGVAREAEWLHDRYVDHRIYARLRGDGWPGGADGDAVRAT